MEKDRGGFPWLLLSALSGVLILGVGLWFGFPLTRMIAGIFLASRSIKQQQAQMQTPAVYQPVAHDLAILCQSAAAIHPTGHVGIAWLPKSVRAFAPNFVTITASNAVVGTGGGFIDFYGYNLERDLTQSARGSNFWRLFFTGRGVTSSPLYAFSTSTSEVVNARDFIEETLAEYQRQAALKQEDIYALRVQQHRINFLLQVDRRRVREACVMATQDLPSHWWPRLALAIVDASHGKNPEAELELTRWVESNPSYSRYMCLAYFYQVMQKPEQAAAAIEKAITYPIVDLPDDMTNTECRGYSAGVYAFGARKYSTVVKLCDALLPVRENGDYAKAALKDLKAKALAAQAGEQVSFEPSDQVLGFNPYEEVDLGALRSSPTP